MNNENFIDVKRLIQSKNPAMYRWIPDFIIRYLERILHQKEINKFIIDNKNVYNIEFCEQVIKFSD